MIKREYRCFFEGQQEKMYFEHVAKKIKEVNPIVSIKFKPVEKLIVLEKSSTDVPKIAVFDYDMNKIEFERKIKICRKTNILYSNLNFDLWLLLHKVNFSKNVQHNDAYKNLIIKNFNLRENCNIKTKANMEKILEQIDIKDIKNAIKNSEQIMNNKLEEDKITIRKNFYYYENPSMNINEFFKRLFEEIKV